MPQHPISIEILIINTCIILTPIQQSKNTRVNVTRKRVHLGRTQFWIKSDPEFGQLSADLTNYEVRLTHLWVTFRSKLTDFYTLKTPGSAWPGKGSTGAKLHSGSKMTRKVVSFLQTWQIMGSDWPSSGSHSASSWLISGSSLTRNGVWPQWTLSGSISDPGVFRV